MEIKSATLIPRLLIYRPPGCYTQTVVNVFLFLCPLGFATTTVAIYYYKKHILRSLNPRLLFMY